MVAGLSGRYRRALRFLGRLVDWERERGLRFTQDTIRLDLFRESLGEIGNPQNACPSVIVAGTKGKGSTAYLLARLLRFHGWKTGLFTSPHLMDIKERIQVDGAPISRLHFVEATECLEESLPYFGELGRSRTYFETLTAAAFLHFRRSKVDVAVLEVGLGGRLDATNVADPDLSIITTISRDHLKALGPGVLAIAAEKAGVLRPGKKLLLGKQTSKVRAFLLERAARLGAPVTLYGDSFESRYRSLDEKGTRFDFVDAAGERSMSNVRLRLLGEHQAGNAAVAIAALPLLGVERDEGRVRAALRSARWPGRGEFLSTDPPLLVDGAHNSDSAGVIARLAAELYPGRKWILLFGGSKGKEFPAIFRRLQPITSELVLTESVHPRHRPAAELLPIAKKAMGKVPVRVMPDQEEALRYSLERQGKRPLLVTGSLYLAGEIRRLYRRILAERRAAVVR